MPIISTDERYTATVVADTQISASLAERGPKGDKGDKGDPGYLAFEIQNGNLILIQNTGGMNFFLKDGFLFMEVN